MLLAADGTSTRSKKYAGNLSVIPCFIPVVHGSKIVQSLLTLDWELHQSLSRCLSDQGKPNRTFYTYIALKGTHRRMICHWQRSRFRGICRKQAQRCGVGLIPLCSSIVIRPVLYLHVHYRNLRSQPLVTVTHHVVVDDDAMVVGVLTIPGDHSDLSTPCNHSCDM